MTSFRTLISSLLIVFNLLVFIGCKTDSQSKDIVKHRADSTYYDDKFVHIDSITESQYNRIPKSSPWSEIDTFSTIHTKHDSLILPIENGTQVTYVNVPATDSNEEGIKIYSLVGVFKPSNYYIVSTEYYESSVTFMVNKANGNVFEVIDIPFVSPSRGYFVSVNWKSSGFGEDEFQLVKITPTGLKELFKINTNVVFDEVKWIDDKKLAVSIIYDIGSSKRSFGMITIK